VYMAADFASACRLKFLEQNLWLLIAASIGSTPASVSERFSSGYGIYVEAKSRGLSGLEYSTKMATPGLPIWKTVVLRSAAFGAAFALALSVIGGVFLWYSTRPKPEKPWNQLAIKATSTNVFFTVEADKLLYEFRYSLENKTDRDYRLPGDAKLLARLAQDMSYRDVPGMTWGQNLYIPSGQKVNISIKLPVLYTDYNFSRQNADDEKQLMAFSDRRLAEIDGFTLFDPTGRYKIDFPNGWPEAAERIKKGEVSKTTKGRS
jgi:hypothetical protein